MHLKSEYLVKNVFITALFRVMSVKCCSMVNDRQRMATLQRSQLKVLLFRRLHFERQYTVKYDIS